MSSDPAAVMSPDEVKPTFLEEEQCLIATPSPQSSSPGDDAAPAAIYEQDFSGHQFYGPCQDNELARALHSIRVIDNSVQPPKFSSEASRVNAPKSSVLRDESVYGNMMEVVFQDKKLGFGTKVHLDETTGTVSKVQVEYVDTTSPAARAGVAKDDFLISVNGEPIEATMTEEQVVNLIKNAEIPKTMLFLRINEDPDPSPSRTIKKGLEKAQSLRLPTKMLSRLQNSVQSSAKLTRASTETMQRWQSARKMVNSALGFRAGKVNEDSFCDGCGVSPIVGHLWSCSTCIEFSLCTTCYERGVHGMENTEDMQALNEATIQSKLKKRCKRFNNAFFLTLRRDICKDRLDKFEYMGSWLADIMGGTPASRITVRGIEIPQLTPDSRQHFVGMLMPLTSDRQDIEIHIEWLNDEKNEGMEVLRIWISDKKSRTKSPFVEQ